MGKKYLILLLVLLSSCISLRSSDKDMIKELESYGIKTKEVQAIKSPGIAASLNIFPGIGNFYLASNSGESDQWIIGGLNLITWPLSILWGIPEAAIDATIINQKAALDYYTFNKKGKKELENFRIQNNYYKD
jgi:hypothetical protein